MLSTDKISTELTSIIDFMADARHKRKRAEGERIQMTPRWKQRVRDRLAENKRNGVEPWDQVQLAAAVGAKDKSGITKMWKATGSTFVPEICRVLQIPPPMHERKEPDDLDVYLDGKTPDQRDRIAKALKTLGI
jgi:hypothetical protein